MKNKKLALKSCAVFSFFVPLLLIVSASCVQALVKIEPPARNLSMFTTSQFTVNISISGVSNVYGFQFDVSYNASVLEFVSISEGRFLNRSDQDRTFCLTPDTSVAGLINDFACSRIGTGSASGTGTLANMTFRLKTLTAFPSVGNINLTQVKISDINSQPLDSSKEDGSVTVYDCLQGETRGCTTPTGCAGTRTCGANNQWSSCVASGGVTETCDGIDNDCDGEIDEGLNRPCSTDKMGICAVGTETCSNSVWTGCPAPQGEICDNGIDESCDGTDPLCLGDITNSTGGLPDRCVDILDLALVGSKFGLTTGSAGFDAKADIKVNGEIDIFDLVAVGKDFGQGANCQN